MHDANRDETNTGVPLRGTPLAMPPPTARNPRKRGCREIVPSRSGSGAGLQSPGSANRQHVLECGGEVVRDQQAQSFAQRFEVGAAEGRLETPLGFPPEVIGFDEFSAAPPRQRDQPITPIVRIDRDRDEAVALQRLQRVGKRSGSITSASASSPTLLGSDRPT